MRRILLLCVLLVLPLAYARADTLLDLTLTGPSTLVTFTLPEHLFFANAIHEVTVGTTTTASFYGVPGYTAYLSFYTGIGNTGQSLGLEVFSLNPALPGGVDVTLYGPPLIALYSGTDYPPPPGDFTALLEAGQFTLPSYTFSSGPPVATYYTLDIVPKIATTPEPSTLALLFTGACTLLATRRLPRPSHRT